MSFEPASAAGLRHELEQAEANLNHFLEVQRTSAEEVARWQGIVTQLKDTIDMIERPAKAIQKVPAVRRGGVGVPRVRWAKHWPEIPRRMRDAAHGIAPTKRELMNEIRSLHNLTEVNSNRAVNKAINKGELVLLMDRCYLPDQAPKSNMRVA
ncbi:MAG TPA: hypothetical protein VND65_18090 [Candidatus Binatia bacterium]|nr:hypothetical protein [Candidatus Binatia bacterium]